MERIIAGRFQSRQDADLAAAHLARYVDTNDISVFQQQDAAPGDIPYNDEDAEDHPSVAKSAASAALAAGLTAGAIAAIGGPVVALIAAGTGAYLGSLVGALGAMHGQGDEPNTVAQHDDDFILSVHIGDPVNEGRVLEILRTDGAAYIQEADGDWQEGHWVDFNPLTMPHLVAGKLH